MVMTSFSVVFGVFVLNLHHKGARLHRAPKWMRVMTLNYMSKFLFFKFNRNTLGLNIKYCPEEQEEMIPYTPTQNGRPSFTYETNYNTCAGSVDSQETELREKVVHHSKSNDEILKLLRYLVDKQSASDEEVKIIREWEEIATVVDRLFFIFFVCFGIVSTISLLILRPMAKDMAIDEFIKAHSQ